MRFELQAIGGVFEYLQRHAVGVGQPGLPCSVNAQFLVGDRDALRTDMRNQRVQLFGLKADMVDLVGLGKAGIRLVENLDEGAFAQFEIIADLIGARWKVKAVLMPSTSR